MRKPVPTPTPRTLLAPRAASLAVDAAKYPNLAANPALERALRIRQALGKGKPRDEAVRLAEQAMGPRAPATMARPRGGKVARPKRTPAGKR